MTERKRKSDYQLDEENRKLMDLMHDDDDDWPGQREEAIRKWFNSVKGNKKRLKGAANYVSGSHYRNTTLHDVFEYRAPNMEDIIIALVEHAPEACRLRDAMGNVPLHFACGFGEPLEVVKALVKADPESVKYADDYDCLPLHHACTTWEKNSCNSLKMKTSLEVIDFVANAYPEALDLKSDHDELPADLLRSDWNTDSLPKDFSGFSEYLERLFHQAFPEHYLVKKENGTGSDEVSVKSIQNIHDDLPNKVKVEDEKGQY